MDILVTRLKKNQYNNYKICLGDLQDSNLWNRKVDVLNPVRNSLCVQCTVCGLLASWDN